MKLKYLLVIIIFLSQMIFSQTLRVHKKDQTTIDFNLSKVDSITFSAVSQNTTTTKIDSASYNNDTNISGVSNNRNSEQVNLYLKKQKSVK